jgi:hypothetical protein
MWLWASLNVSLLCLVGVVSGTSACTYLASTIDGIPIVGSSIALLFFFAVLTCMGISESAVFALGIFIIHISTLVVLSCFAIVFIVRNKFEILRENLFETDYPTVDVAGTMYNISISRASVILV